MKPMHPARGFSLLELLVALAIFAVMAVMAYGGLQTVLSSAAQVSTTAEQTNQIQMAFSRLAQDLTQLLQRPMRDAFGDEQPAVEGSAQRVRFTRSGWQNPLQRKRSDLQRVAWLLEEDTLYRRYWQVLDGAAENEWQQMPILSQVKNLEFRYLDTQQVWHQEWPPAVPGDLTAPVSLKAVEIRLRLPGWGDLRRLWSVPERFNPLPVNTDTAAAASK